MLVVRRVAPDGTMSAGSVIDERSVYLGEQATRPAFAPAPGGALLAYNAQAESGFGEVFVRRLDAAGVPVAAPTRLTSSDGNGLDTDGGARWPALAYEPSRGEYLAVWESHESSVLRPFAVRAQRLDGTGGPVGTPIAVSPAPTLLDHSAGPSVVADPASQAWIVARLERGPSASPQPVRRLLGRRLPFSALSEGGPEVPLDDPDVTLGPAALAPGALLVWRPSDSTAGPVARRLGSGPDPGVASLDAPPSGHVNTRDVDLRPRSTRAGAGFECRLDGGGWGGCELRGLRDGIHRVTVRSVGPEGWVELGEGVAARWRTEVALPETTLTEFPSTTGAPREVRLDGVGAVDLRVPLGRRRLGAVRRERGRARARGRPAHLRGARRSTASGGARPRRSAGRGRSPRTPPHARPKSRS